MVLIDNGPDDQQADNHNEKISRHAMCFKYTQDEGYIARNQIKQQKKGSRI